MPSNDAAAKRARLRFVLLIGVALVGLSVVFGVSTWNAHEAFQAHRSAENSEAFRWNQETLSVDACRSEVLAWAAQCKGIQSWCEAAIPDLIRECLSTQDRQAYCDEAGESVKSTRFGYEECRAYYDAITDTYQKRAAKKHCALSYRAIAGYCEKLPEA